MKLVSKGEKTEANETNCSAYGRRSHRYFVAKRESHSGCRCRRKCRRNLYVDSAESPLLASALLRQVLLRVGRRSLRLSPLSLMVTR